MKTILVVDDIKSDQLLAQGLLKSLGTNTIICNNAQEALDWLKNNVAPDLILLDVVMPGVSGYDLCRQIRGDLALEDVPIIFCSTKKEDYDRFWALRQGGNAYLTKPYSPSELMKTVKAYIS
ncbi:MAG: CheY subfamily protein Rre11/TaxY2 [Cyanobacteriota bacterium]|jgi:twitching motility two-component system response regulator PilH